jgi:hypothetical protein
VLNAGNRPRSVELRSYSQCYVDIGVGTVSNLYCISRVHLIVSLHHSLSGYFHKSLLETLRCAQLPVGPR